MRKLLWFSAGLLGIPVLFGWSWLGWHRPQPAPNAAPTTANSAVTAPDRSRIAVRPTLKYRLYPHPQATIHTLTIPAGSGYQVRPLVVATLQTVEQIAQTSGAIAVLNGGYFDPANQKSTAFVIRDGKTIADPQTNDRFIANDSIIPYLDKILNRSEWRRYQCDSAPGGDRYAIAAHGELPPPGCQLIDSLGAGPQLRPQSTAIAESFWTENGTQPRRDPIGMNQLNARSAIGLTRDGDIIWVMAAQALPEKPGLSLPGLAQVMADLGAVAALNLDGGSSASLFYAGQAFYGKQDEAGAAVKRGVKSVLVIQP